MTPAPAPLPPEREAEIRRDQDVFEKHMGEIGVKMSFCTNWCIIRDLLRELDRTRDEVAMLRAANESMSAACAKSDRRIERLEKALRESGQEFTRFSGWRERARKYDEDMGHQIREFDESEWDRMEEKAAAASERSQAALTADAREEG
jgi:hypothetical protein